MEELFRRFADTISNVLASGLTFAVALILIASSGEYFHFSQDWTNWLNTIITISTFLLLFVSQKSQSLSDKVTHLKLDELIRAVETARNDVVAVENKEEKVIDKLRQTVIEEIADHEAVERSMNNV